MHKNEHFSKRWEVFADFQPIFSKIFFMKQMQYIHPQKVWLLYLLYLVIFLILNDRHNQQKLQIYLNF